MNEIQNSPNSLFDGVKQKLISKSVYFSHEFFRIAPISDGKFQLQPISTLKPLVTCIVVARQHYNESVRTFPVESRTELKKLLLLEYESKRIHYRICKIENGKSTVNIWEFDEAVPYGLCVIPESVVFSNLLTPSQVLTVGSQPELYVSKAGNTVFSQFGTSLIKSASMFLMSFGGSSDAEKIICEQESKASLLAKGIKHLTSTDFRCFIQVPDKQQVMQKLKPLSFLVAGVYVIFLLASSLYLGVHKHYLMGEDEKVRPLLRGALTQKDNSRENTEALEAYRTFFDSQNNHANYWLVLAEMFEIAQFTALSYDNGRFTLTGRADKATDILAKLNDSEKVFEPRFEQPIRRNRSKEMFVISFSLQADESAKEEL